MTIHVVITVLDGVLNVTDSQRRGAVPCLCEWLVTDDSWPSIGHMYQHPTRYGQRVV